MSVRRGQRMGFVYSVNVRRIHLENWTEAQIQQIQTGGHTKEVIEMCWVFFTLQHINYVQ